MTSWPSKIFSRTPLINVGSSNVPVSVGPLFTTFIQTPEDFTCQTCEAQNQPVMNVVMGKYTVLWLDRLGRNRNIPLRTQLIEARTGAMGEQFMEILSVLCVIKVLLD